MKPMSVHIGVVLGFFLSATSAVASTEQSVERAEDVASVELRSPVAVPIRAASQSSLRRYQRSTLDTPRIFAPTKPRRPFIRYPWKRNIVTTVFWIGELPTQYNPVPNDKSSWDRDWMKNYGGVDHPDPKKRTYDYRPRSFVPKLNPFYIALPYNDISRWGTKKEASRVIPWFRRSFEKNGTTVLQGRWIAIRKGNRVCYAQWEDVGPYRTDHWQYVFGKARPSPNRNRGAGLDVSPAVRDYLGIEGIDVTDWRFVELSEVPEGPWRKYGKNNPFVVEREQRSQTKEIAAEPTSDSAKKESS